jgi:UDP-3-O-[3-hydroxymyristoyl] glucosamine N-acyltransferase
VANTVQELAALVNGQVHGDGSCVIQAARACAEAQPGDITFIENDHHLRQLGECKASAVVLPAGLQARAGAVLQARPGPQTLVLVPDALGAFITIMQHLLPKHHEAPAGVDPRADVHPSVQLGPQASIGPFVCIGAGTQIGARCRIYPGVVIGCDCRIGDDATLYPNCVIYDRTVLGHRCMIHANAVLGADGFGYRFQEGKHVKVPQLGTVELGNDVEVGACATIDRGTFQATRIGPGTKIDNLVMIGHNCQIGAHNVLAGQVGIAGSCTTGNYVVMAGQVGVADHVQVGDRALLGAQSGIMRHVPPGQRVLGYPARAEREQKRMMLCLEQLPELIREFRRLKRRLGLDNAADDKGEAPAA